MADDDFDWIDDAFDDRRTAEDMRKKPMSTPMGCIIAIVALVLFAALVVMGAWATLGLLAEL